MCSWSCSTAAAHPPNGGRPARHSTQPQWGPIRCAFLSFHVSPICFWTRAGADCSSLRPSTFTHSVIFPHLSKGSLWNFWRWFDAHETGSKWVNALASRCCHSSRKLLCRRANRPIPMRSRIDVRSSSLPPTVRPASRTAHSSAHVRLLQSPPICPPMRLRLSAPLADGGGS